MVHARRKEKRMTAPGPTPTHPRWWLKLKHAAPEFSLRKMVDAAVDTPDCRSTRGETEQKTNPTPIRLNELNRRLPPLCTTVFKNGGFGKQLGVSVLALAFWRTRFSFEPRKSSRCCVSNFADTFIIDIKSFTMCDLWWSGASLPNPVSAKLTLPDRSGRADGYIGIGLAICSSSVPAVR
jgi:hypothetical protein